MGLVDTVLKYFRLRPRLYDLSYDKVKPDILRPVLYYTDGTQREGPLLAVFSERVINSLIEARDRRRY